MRKSVKSFFLTIFLILVISTSVFALDTMSGTYYSPTNSSVSLTYCSSIEWWSLFHPKVTGTVMTVNSSVNYTHKTFVSYFLYEDGAAVKADLKSTSDIKAILYISYDDGDKVRSVHRLLNPSTDTAVLSKTIVND